MSEVPVRLQALYGGISRQPAHLRFPWQTGMSSNATYSVVDGISDRPGSTFVGAVYGVDPTGEWRFHAIERDDLEKYLVIYGGGNDPIRVMDLWSGLEATVTITPEAQTYLSTGSPTADQLRFRTIVDSTLIVNTVAEPIEVGAGNQPQSNTMPIRLVRTAAANIDLQIPAEFEIDVIEWSARPSGDSSTNIPTFLGKNLKPGLPIRDIEFFQGRLVIAADEYLFFSQAGDLFNLYIEDITTVTDADPIELQLSTDQVTLVDYIVPFRDSLLLFTRAGRQFQLEVGDLLSPLSPPAANPTTSYRTLPVRPGRVADLVYFVGPLGGGVGAFEFFYDDLRVSNFAVEVTQHTPNLLPTDIRRIDTAPNEFMVFVLPQDGNAIYTYASYFNGAEKQQSAWGRWVFDVNYRILDIAVIQNDLYLLIGGYDGVGFSGSASGGSSGSGADLRSVVVERIPIRDDAVGCSPIAIASDGYEIGQVPIGAPPVAGGPGQTYVDPDYPEGSPPGGPVPPDGGIVPPPDDPTTPPGTVIVIVPPIVIIGQPPIPPGSGAASGSMSGGSSGSMSGGSSGGSGGPSSLPSFGG